MLALLWKVSFESNLLKRVHFWTWRYLHVLNMCLLHLFRTLVSGQDFNPLSANPTKWSNTPNNSSAQKEKKECQDVSCSQIPFHVKIEKKEFCLTVTMNLFELFNLSEYLNLSELLFCFVTNLIEFTDYISQHT